MYHSHNESAATQTYGDAVGTK